jgi:hypothetical protein
MNVSIPVGDPTAGMRYSVEMLCSTGDTVISAFAEWPRRLSLRHSTAKLPRGPVSVPYPAPTSYPRGFLGSNWTSIGTSTPRARSRRGITSMPESRGLGPARFGARAACRRDRVRLS